MSITDLHYGHRFPLLLSWFSSRGLGGYGQDPGLGAGDWRWGEPIEAGERRMGLAQLGLADQEGQAASLG
jgi:hypothetical protein